MTETVNTTTGEIAVPLEGEIVSRNHLPAEQVELVNAFLQSAVPSDADDPEVIGTRIMAQLLAAETPEEVLADAEAVGLRQYLDTPFLLEGVDFRQSEYEEGMPFYCLLFGREVESGEKVTLTTGAQSVVAQAFRLAQRGWLPRTVMAKQAKKATKSGFYPVRLVDAQ